MKSTKKEKLKKLGSALIGGAKKSATFVQKYGPKAHAHLKRVSDSTMDAMIPRRTRTVVDLTAREKPRRIKRTRKGFFLDYTK